MSTRAMYTFIEPSQDVLGQKQLAGETYHVYKHCYGYPRGGLSAIKNALSHSWELPRFEADEFAAGFIAGNKGGEGNLRVMKSGLWQEVAPFDLEYRYEISLKDGKLHVVIFAVHCEGWDDPTPKWTEEEICRGTLAEVHDQIVAREAQEA